ncbi:MAG: hypothetical protein EAZ16_01860 [Sphingobacteriales bacterium]|nr:MAG: hypothetical protein EAZ16_01860 [Sphingobacteriales bacterium]
MKPYFFALMLAFSVIACTKTNSSNSSNSTGVIAASAVPGTIKSAFAAKYPTATGEIDWQKEDGNTYKVKFFIGSNRWQAIFNADGSFVSEKLLG